MKVLSPDDGRLSIVQAAQQLCRAVEQKEKTSKDINVTVLDSLLRGEDTACLLADQHKPTVKYDIQSCNLIAVKRALRIEPYKYVMYISA